MAWGGDWQLSDQSTGVGRVDFFDFVTAAELAWFHNFFNLLTNPVRNLLLSARFSQKLAFCEPD